MKDSVFDQLVNEAVETIKKGNKIITSGLGKNVPICEKFVGSMVSMGLPAYFLHTNSAVHGDLGLVKKDDLVIVLTKSGETTESIYLTKHLENHEANIWLLSFNQEIYLDIFFLLRSKKVSYLFSEYYLKILLLPVTKNLFHPLDIRYVLLLFHLNLKSF